MTIAERLLDITHFSSLLIVVLGVFGNGLLFATYARRPLTKLSISLYFRVIACMNLFVTLNMLKVFFRDRYEYNVADVSSLLCKAVYYTVYCAGPISSWTLVVVSLDRLLTIAYPMRFPFLGQRRFQVLVLIVVFAFNMTYYLYLIFDSQLHARSDDSNASNASLTLYCDISNDKKLYWLDLVNSSLLPFIAMMVCIIYLYTWDSNI